MSLYDVDSLSSICLLVFQAVLFRTRLDISFWYGQPMKTDICVTTNGNVMLQSRRTDRNIDLENNIPQKEGETHYNLAHDLVFWCG